MRTTPPYLIVQDVRITLSYAKKLIYLIYNNYLSIQLNAEISSFVTV